MLMHVFQYYTSSQRKSIRTRREVRWSLDIIRTHANIVTRWPQWCSYSWASCPRHVGHWRCSRHPPRRHHRTHWPRCHAAPLRPPFSASPRPFLSPFELLRPYIVRVFPTVTAHLSRLMYIPTMYIYVRRLWVFLMYIIHIIWAKLKHNFNYRMRDQCIYSNPYLQNINLCMWNY